MRSVCAGIHLPMIRTERDRWTLFAAAVFVVLQPPKWKRLRAQATGTVVRLGSDRRLHRVVSLLSEAGRAAHRAWWELAFGQLQMKSHLDEAALTPIVRRCSRCQRHCARVYGHARWVQVMAHAAGVLFPKRLRGVGHFSRQAVERRAALQMKWGCDTGSPPIQWNQFLFE